MIDVIHVLPSLEFCHGGPSRTVPALAAAQAALGAQVVLAAAGPVPEATRQLHPQLTLQVFPLNAGPGGSLLRASSQLDQFLQRSPARAIHAHGVWLRPLHYAARAAATHAVPLILAPRGMLEPWARAHRSWKKRLAATFVHPRAFTAVAGWHATSAQEAKHLPAIAAAPCCIAPNGIAAPDRSTALSARTAWLEAYPKLRDTRIALFYGRLHRKKRVAELISLWRSTPRPGWTLLIAGIPGDYSLAELTARAGQDATSAIIIADGGPLPSPYPLAEIFLLPSHSENFGQAIAEALSWQVPALVTDTLPWSGLTAAGAGQSVSWDAYPAALHHLLQLSPEALAAQGRAGSSWVLREFSWTNSAQHLLDFYPTFSR